MAKKGPTLVQTLFLLLLSSQALLLVAAFLFLFEGRYPLFWVILGCDVFLIAATVLSFREMGKVNRCLKLYAKGSGIEPLQSVKHSISKEFDELIALLMEENQSDKLLEENRRQAQYLALQNQINPHFLYNTLEAIRSEALIGGLVNVAEMSETLARFFRYIISNTSGLVLLEDELKNVKDYFAIQKFRFGDRMSLDLKISPDNPILGYHLPKLILQPIVENAIIHGLEEKVEGGTITISAEHNENDVVIIIEDDGVGMDSKVLVELNRKLNDHSPRKDDGEKKKGGIAIANVNERLQLLFGLQYGLAYYSVTGIGTKVEIRLPLKGVF
jgi:two-component system sensor histidine kinase YesM